MCLICNKIFKDRSGLWRHKKKCFQKVPLEKDILEEKETLPADMQGPVMGGPPQGEEPPPEDNTVQNDEEPESLTPGLDDEVNKSVISINKKRK